MYNTEKIIESISEKELWATLQGISEDDYFESDFSRTQLLKDFLCLLELYDLVYITSTEQRVLLTLRGEKYLQTLSRLLI